MLSGPLLILSSGDWRSTSVVVEDPSMSSGFPYCFQNTAAVAGNPSNSTPIIDSIPSISSRGGRMHNGEGGHWVSIRNFEPRQDTDEVSEMDYDRTSNSNRIRKIDELEPMMALGNGTWDIRRGKND